MSDYERTLAVEAPADQVFRYVSDTGNLPHYVPTVKSAESLDGQRIRLRGENYSVEGYFKVDAEARQIEWSAEGDQNYSGWMEVDTGDVTSEFSEVTISLSFGDQPVSDAPTQRDERILEELDRTLKNIQQHVEHAHRGRKANFL